MVFFVSSSPSFHNPNFNEIQSDRVLFVGSTINPFLQIKLSEWFPRAVCCEFIGRGSFGKTRYMTPSR